MNQWSADQSNLENLNLSFRGTAMNCERLANELVDISMQMFQIKVGL